MIRAIAILGVAGGLLVGCISIAPVSGGPSSEPSLSAATPLATAAPLPSDAPQATAASSDGPPVEPTATATTTARADIGVPGPS